MTYQLNIDELLLKKTHKGGINSERLKTAIDKHLKKSNDNQDFNIYFEEEKAIISFKKEDGEITVSSIDSVHFEIRGHKTYKI